MNEWRKQKAFFLHLQQLRMLGAANMAGITATINWETKIELQFWKIFCYSPLYSKWGLHFFEDKWLNWLLFVVKLAQRLDYFFQATVVFPSKKVREGLFLWNTASKPIFISLCYYLFTSTHILKKLFLETNEAFFG